MARPGRPRNAVLRVLDWLRAGYPEGVPQGDYVALLGILRRQLTEEEIVQIASTLTGGAFEDREDRIRHAIKQRTLQTATDEEVGRVSARLAIVGWPLGLVEVDSPDDDETVPTVSDPDLADPSPSPTPETRPVDVEARRNVMTRLIAWVRQGYPTGVPAADYVPLIALLSRRLTKDEVGDIVVELRESGVLPNETGRIGAAIMGTTNEVPSIEEIERVRHHLSEVTGTDFSQD